jgi:hypothetical protein
MSRRPTARRPQARTGLLAAALVLAGGCAAEARQPIAYNHQLHVKKLELGCDTCHEGSRTGDIAGLPPVSTCSACHQELNGSSPEEKKIVEAVRAGREVAWVRLYDVPPHVYFTHRRHVAVAEIACERCHGEMRSQARPPPRALVALTMDGCLECHRQRGASRDCDACHR